jgi:hypothetical protein
MPLPTQTINETGARLPIHQNNETEGRQPITSTWIPIQPRPSSSITITNQVIMNPPKSNKSATLHKIKRLRCRKIGETRDFLKPCKEIVKTSNTLITDMELINIAKQKLHPHVLDYGRYERYTTFDQFETKMVNWDRCLTSPFQWDAFVETLNDIGRGYLETFLREYGKFRNPHDFGTSAFFKILCKFPADPEWLE